ncbi:MAG: hypothetical protein GKR93_08860 [Gammaproteobacteria bacterium]|nr:hypothetical protein [Gammaproteobacteria bacterium]
MTIKLTALIALLTTFISTNLYAEQGNPAFNGVWVINEELSDDTDKQVEKAIKDSGGKVGRTKKKGKGRYKGGPPEQAMYDHISYDETLTFQYDTPEFKLIYEEGFQRVFHSDGRRRSVSARGKPRGEREDFAFASWSGPNKLFVEARPRDGGRTNEVYTLKKSSEGQLLLHVELKLTPLLFSGSVHINRYYEKQKQP